jgi:hypothetical protein
MAGHGRSNMIELVAQPERGSELGQFGREVGRASGMSVLPSGAGVARTSIAVGPKRSISRPSPASLGAPPRAGRSRLVQLDDVGHQQRLRAT